MIFFIFFKLLSSWYVSQKHVHIVALIKLLLSSSFTLSLSLFLSLSLSTTRQITKRNIWSQNDKQKVVVAFYSLICMQVHTCMSWTGSVAIPSCGISLKDRLSRTKVSCLPLYIHEWIGGFTVALFSFL